MIPDLSELLKKARALPPEARAALAGSLLESLDDTVDQGAEEEWSKEIGRRIAELGFWQSETHSLGGSSPPNLSDSQVTIRDILLHLHPTLPVN